LNKNVALMVVIASCVFVGNTFGADWKYYGEFTTGTDTEEVLFYDSGSIISTNNSIKLWVKNVLKSDIEKVLKNKLVIERATKKIADGYNPPITKIYPNVANAAYLEEAVSESSIKSKAEILYQIMCNENKLRKIAGASFNKDGRRDQRFGISKWEDIAPESNADNLAKIVCGTK
jgi:hypothetical protein